MNPALTQAISAASLKRGDIVDRRSLPLFQEGLGPYMFKGVPVTIDDFIANYVQSQRLPRRRPVIFPPNSPLGKLQRAYGVR